MLAIMYTFPVFRSSAQSSVGICWSSWNHLGRPAPRRQDPRSTSRQRRTSTHQTHRMPLLRYWRSHGHTANRSHAYKRSLLKVVIGHQLRLRKEHLHA